MSITKPDDGDGWTSSFVLHPGRSVIRSVAHSVDHLPNSARCCALAGVGAPQKIAAACHFYCPSNRYSHGLGLFLGVKLNYMRSARSPLISLNKAHPVVPGSPICGMRMPCGGRVWRAREGIEWLRAISVSTVPRGPKVRRTATDMPISGSKHPKTGNPAPFQISPATPIY
jgi:hypothetical protein